MGLSASGTCQGQVVSSPSTFRGAHRPEARHAGDGLNEPTPQIRVLVHGMLQMAGEEVEAVSSSWRRLSDGPQRRADARGARGGQAPPVNVDEEALQVATWENEGGQSTLAAEPLKILIVDDDIESSSSLELMLRASGQAHARVAYSGHAAIAIAADFQPSMVLMELGLPDMGGNELAGILRERARGHHLRLIALTSCRRHAGGRSAPAAGFECCLLKPVAAIDLVVLLADAASSQC